MSRPDGWSEFGFPVVGARVRIADGVDAPIKTGRIRGITVAQFDTHYAKKGDILFQIPVELDIVDDLGRDMEVEALMPFKIEELCAHVEYKVSQKEYDDVDSYIRRLHDKLAEMNSMMGMGVTVDWNAIPEATVARGTVMTRGDNGLRPFRQEYGSVSTGNYRLDVIAPYPRGDGSQQRDERNIFGTFPAAGAVIWGTPSVPWEGASNVSSIDAIRDVIQTTRELREEF